MAAWTHTSALAIGVALASAPCWIAACSLVVSTDGLAGETAVASVVEDGGERPPPADADLRMETSVDAGPPQEEIDASNAASCADVLRMNPAAASGTYAIGVGADARSVYCEMTLSGGGWARAIDLDAARDGCPSGWRYDSEPRGCRRSTDGTDGATFDPPQSSFTEVLLAASGRQRATPDAFHESSINAAYMDGVSVTTRIDGNRVHVFSFAVGLTEDVTVEPDNHCPCDQGARAVPSFVGASFLCDTAWTTGYPDSVWHARDLWGQGARGADCATGDGAGARLVAVKLPRASSAPIEVRLMADQERGNEDVALKSLVVFVR